MKKILILNHKAYMEYEDVIDYIKEIKDKSQEEEKPSEQI